MAIKLSSKNRDNIPTLTEVVAGDEGQPSQPIQPEPAEGDLKDNIAGQQLPPKFERILEKIIYKKLHPQLVTTSQALAAEIMIELQKHLQTADSTQNKTDNHKN
ncbi:MAG TPA: hypothetical protein VF268_08890 [Gammaproteobacteria bacterium]